MKLTDKLKESLKTARLESDKFVEEYFKRQKRDKELAAKYCNLANFYMSTDERSQLIERCIAKIADKRNVRNLCNYIFEYGKRYGEKLYLEDDNYDSSYLIDEKYRVDAFYGHITVTKVSEDEVTPKMFENEYCQIYKPNGELLIETNNDLIFNDILIQIRGKLLEGYYVMFKGHRLDITPKGHIKNRPIGFFDIYAKQLGMLMGF